MFYHATYNEDTLLRLAKRVNNPKRSYLLVNPLQGKHIPVAPTEAMSMMRCIGKAVCEKHTGRPLVIGFSETATAIGVAVASEISNDCVYIQTTREQDTKVQKWVFFSEEHSHATEQKLCGDDLNERIACSDYILLVDDEISTGKTILNIAAAIRKACPAAKEKEFVVASLINRISKSMLPAFAEQGIAFEYLLHLDAEDYEEKVKSFDVREAETPRSDCREMYETVASALSLSIPSARLGVVIGEYVSACQAAGEEILQEVEIDQNDDVLVLGTEEFMFPALLLGYMLQKRSAARSVKFHATTRSPIGISSVSSYPIQNGIRIHSFYDKERISYLYDLAHYDAVILFTDAPVLIPEAIKDIQRGLEEKHCSKVYFFYCGHHV